MDFFALFFSNQPGYAVAHYESADSALPTNGQGSGNQTGDGGNCIIA